MSVFKLNLKLLSDTLIGSGEGWGAIIDNDIVFDDFGLPYIPARRVKGCLRESALEVMEMFEQSGIGFASRGDIGTLFGKPGQSESGALSFSNCYLGDYSLNKQWIEWLISEYPDIFSKDAILDTFTSIRQQTAVNKNEDQDSSTKKGVAEKASLRTSRVLDKGIKFSGSIESSFELENRLFDFLVFAVRNLRYMGTNRNRGLGSVLCTLTDESRYTCDESLKNLELKVMEG
jgi:CRISPR/Cas system CSM-associated protein Csm3 (group 7 of RAMP superfamily)